MTAPDVVKSLAEAYMAAIAHRETPEQAAARLLPVVLADRRRAQAQALREASEWLFDHPDARSPWHHLEDRADAIEAGEDER